MLREAVKTLSTVVDLLGPRVPGPRLLIYHQVGTGSGLQMEVRLDDFRRQVEWLAENRRIVDLEVAIARRGEPDADQMAVLTFDDGYADTYRWAFPLLRAGRIPFTLYLTTAPVETGRGPRAGAEPLTWKQIEEMLDSGLLTLGAHTHTHADLRRLEASAVEEELDTANRLITRRLGVNPRHFAYPWGYWAPQADAAVRERYVSAVLGGGGRGIDGATDPYRLHRYPIQLADRFVFFKRRLHRGFPLEEGIRRRLRGYRGP